jgi:hypothetical protein
VFSIPTYLLLGRIRGGRGVATALGASLILLPPPITVFSICVFLILFSLHKILPIDIIVSFFLTTMLTFFLLFTGHGAGSQAFFSIAISIILLFTHQHYIASYFHGKLEYSMNKDSESVNINKIKQSIKDIKVNDGASFDEFLDNVRSIIKKDIIFSKCEMPTGTTGSILVGEKFHILYDANVSPLHQIQIKLHELGHLILGHAVNQESKKDNELIDSVLKTQQIYDNLLQGHLRRNKYNDIEEKEAELFATEILSKLRLDLDFNNDPLVKIGLG